MGMDMRMEVNEMEKVEKMELKMVEGVVVRCWFRFSQGC
jgi:hypothetical protein